MFYKNWPYWLKGAIVGLLVMLILQIIGLLIHLFAVSSGSCFGGWCVFNSLSKILPVLIMGYLFGGLLSVFILNSSMSSFVIAAIIFYLAYPFLGMIIGLSYGKIRKLTSLDLQIKWAFVIALIIFLLIVFSSFYKF